MSSVTRIWPSQKEDDPMPIVGIFNLLVINLDAIGATHSNTTEKAPAFSIRIASLKSFLALTIVSPSISIP